MAKDLSTLGWDYVVFVAFVLFSTITPLWTRIFGQTQQKTKKDYVFATGGVSLIAVMLSLGRGTLGVRSVLGYPAELFYRGSTMWETVYGMINSYPIVCFVFVPVYFNLGITSIYRYLDLRFKSHFVRCLASGTFIFRQMLSTGITIYTPSVAISSVIGIPYYASILGMSTICIFFTVVGGLKAAIHADVIQTLTVIIFSLVVVIWGTVEADGPRNVLRQNVDNGRLKFMNFTGDMTVRVDTTSAWLGQLFMSLSQFGCQQNFMQRYLSLGSLKEVKKAMMSNIPLIFIFFSLSWLCGMVIYATYVNCDPLQEGFIKKADEILIFYVEDRLSFLPGFLGLCVATLFNGALSLNVSNFNSVSTVVWEDFLKPLPQFKGLNDKQQLVSIKIIAAILGIIAMGLAFGVGQLSGVIESSMLAFSATSGPLLGVFILAMMIPIANWKGASAGMIVSHLLILWLTFGSLTLDKTNAMLPTSTEGCTNSTFAPDIIKPVWLENGNNPITTWWSNNITQSQYTQAERSPLDKLYKISYMYYSFLGTTITVVVAIVVSYLTRTNDDLYDSKLLNPFVFRICECFPGAKPYYIKSKTPRSDDVTNIIKITKIPTVETISQIVDQNKLVEIYRKKDFV